MPDLQIPNVTIEDLQSFQAKHFPWSAQPPTPQYQYHETVDYPLEAYNDEDDLGYYPDGTKRTLTDEQIRIFRHSEIHALLREKELREEALLEAREEEEDEKASEVRKPSASDKDKEPLNEQERAGGQEASAVLDYGEDVPARNARKRARPDSTAQFAGRRIISYDD